MIDLKEMQFEILPTEDASEGVGFGIGMNVSVDDGGFSPGATSWASDEDQGVDGTTAFGQDKMLGPTWAWLLHVNRETVTEALESLGELATAWRMREIRDKPGEVLAIRYRIGHRVRRVYGRPRTWDAPPNNLILNGMVPITANFKAVDAYVYDDEEEGITLSASSGSEGGFVFPVTFPVTTLPVGEQQDQAVVGGDAPTYPIIRFNGPRVNPELVTADWALRLNMTIPDGQYVDIDTRPWRRTALLNGTSSVAGNLGRRQWISKVTLEPGRTDMLFRGSGGSGDCAVRWRSAWNSL